MGTGGTGCDTRVIRTLLRIRLSLGDQCIARTLGPWAPAAKWSGFEGWKKDWLCNTPVVLPHNQVLAVLALVRSFFHRYTRLQQLLDSESDHIASGVYRSDVDDPDFSNPYASSCWELALLRFHWHPKAASFSLGTAKLEATLPNENPVAMMTKYNVEFNGQFVPKLVVPKPNPFHGKLQVSKTSWKTQHGG